MGHVIILGEAYAFGVVWSFVFKALSMVVLRFTHREHREYMVPLNIKFGNVYFPIGLSLIFLVLLITAILNFFTKEVATIGGTAFTVVFVTVFIVSEHFHEKKRKASGVGGKHHQHIEQFNQAAASEITSASLGLKRPYHKLVSIRSVQNLFMLEKALAETDPATTDMVVMTAKVAPTGEALGGPTADLDAYDQKLMTAVVDKAENAGKQVKPLIVPTNNPLHAVLKTAMEIQAQELIMGASNKYTVDEQLEQIAFYWINLHDGNTAPLTVRILSRERDVYLDIAGGSRIPKISERSARSVSELRAAGVGVDRVLLLHDGSRAHSDLFQAVVTLLDPEVALGVLPVANNGVDPTNSAATVHQDEERAQAGPRLDRPRPVEDRRPGDRGAAAPRPVRSRDPATAGRIAVEPDRRARGAGSVHRQARPLPGLPGVGAGHSAGGGRYDAERDVADLSLARARGWLS